MRGQAAPSNRYTWYEDRRQVASANYGTNGNVGAPTRPASAPAASDTILVSLTHYNDRGEAFESVSPDCKVDRSYSDDAGRQTLTVRNFVPPGSGCYSPGEEQNVVIRRTYLAGGRLGELIAVNPNTGDQVTTYEYGVTLSGSDLASNDLLAAEVYPDSIGSSDQVSYAYNRQGQTKSIVDQRGTTHAYVYDALDRRTADSITALGGADGSIRRLSRTYDVRGLVEKATSYSDAAGNAIVSEVRNAYNDFGQLTVQWQEHDGAVNVSTSPKVQCGFADGSANMVRPTSITYPDGVVLEYLYSDDAADALSRPRTLRFDGDNVCTYIYLGLSTFVRTDYPEPEVRLTAFLGSGTDLYAAFDRFGRVVEQRWQTFASPTTKIVQLKYGYDRASNRLWREDFAASALGVDLDELYAYNGVDRLEAFYRGNLVSDNTAIASASAQQAWDLDSVGNWQNVSETIGANSLDQQRTFNTVNEITDISRTVGPNWADPVYDAAGNMTRVTRRAPSPDRWKATWDAWNRLVLLEESDGSGGWLPKQENVYDEMNRRIVRKTYASGTLDETRHYYWKANWQGIEERVEVTSVQEPERQYVYGLRYIDDVVLRDRDTQVGDSGSSSDALVYDERLYAMQDANWNVVALCDDLGTVQRRYAYQPYGDALVLDASFGAGGPDLQWTKTFASYEYDRDVDLFQVRWRWYSPLLGTWLRRDPAGYRDGMNLYGMESITDSTDPFGLIRWRFDSQLCHLELYVVVQFDFRKWKNATYANKWTFQLAAKTQIESAFNSNAFRMYPNTNNGTTLCLPPCHLCGIKPMLYIDLSLGWVGEQPTYEVNNPPWPWYYFTGGNVWHATDPDTTANVKPFVPNNPLANRSNAERGDAIARDVGDFMNLDTHDVYIQPKQLGGLQVPVAHEFGHVLGNPHPGQLKTPPEAPGTLADYAADAPGLMGLNMTMRSQYFGMWLSYLDEEESSCAAWTIR